MALTQTPQGAQDFSAPPFALKATDGKTYSFDDVKGEKGTLVLFICNHCPYVKAVIDRMVADAKIAQDNGIGVVAIMSNDTEKYPADSFDNMKVFAAAHGFTFPYLIDETQDVARAYNAVCTPDIFGFNAAGILQYRGRVDSAGMNDPGPDMVHEMRDAMLQIAQTGQGPAQQVPSMGCSIKWR